MDIEDDFCLTHVKKGGSGRKQPREKHKNTKDPPTCYSSKHIRIKEAIMTNHKMTPTK